MIVSILKQLLILSGLFIVIFLYYQRFEPVPTIHDFVVFDDRFFRVKRIIQPEENTDDMKSALRLHIQKTLNDASIDS